MKSLLISGIAGKVGSFVNKYAPEYGFLVACGVDKNNFIEANCPVYKNFDEVKENIDVIIDFSSSSLTEKAVEFALANKCAFVCGTTALSEKTLEKINRLTLIVPTLICSNFSEGLPVFLNAAKYLKNNLNGFDTEICEIHNAKKKDAPSGTAIALSKETDTQKIHSIRGGDIAGVHTIYYLGNGEEITISHRVYDKSVFARGALKAASKLLNTKK